MPNRTKLFVITLALLLPACMAAQTPSAAEPEAAKRMWAPETGFDDTQIRVESKTPPAFTLVLKREMPTPGWTIRIDALDIDPESNRITAKLTEQAPGGMTAQVITPTKFELPLGTVPAGAYFVEVWTRRNQTAPHQPAHAVILIAR